MIGKLIHGMFEQEIAEKPMPVVDHGQQINVEFFLI